MLDRRGTAKCRLRKISLANVRGNHSTLSLLLLPPRVPFPKFDGVPPYPYLNYLSLRSLRSSRSLALVANLVAFSATCAKGPAIKSGNKAGIIFRP